MPGETRWTARDHAMARRILDHTSPIGRTLVVAGNAHTPTARSRLGVPMGAWLAQQRPEVDTVRIRYGDGTIYNLGAQPLTSDHRPTRYHLHLDDGALLLDHPHPAEADVPHRPDPAPFPDPRG